MISALLTRLVEAAPRTVKPEEAFAGIVAEEYDKAVTALSTALSSSFIGGSTTGTLKVESLEATLELITFNASHVKQWRYIPRLLGEDPSKITLERVADEEGEDGNDK